MLRSLNPMATGPSQPPQREYVAPSERPSGLLVLLKRRYFRRMWAVTTVSSLGDWLGVFALVVYVASSDHPISGAKAEFAVGGVLLFRVVPGLFFGPFGGVLADRFDRRRLMVSADIARAFLIASIPWVHTLWELYLVSSLMEMLGQMWMPSKDATIPNLVQCDQLMMANQLSQISTYASFPFAGALVALLVAPAHLLQGVFPALKAHPVILAFFFDAGTFLFSASRVATFPRELMKVKRARAPGARWNPFSDLLEGLRFFTTEHTASEGAGPVANQKFCLGCHRSSDEAVAPLVTSISHVSRAGRSTATNFVVTAFNPATGGGVAADSDDPLRGPGRTAAFTIFGDFSPSAGTFLPLDQFSGFVQHTRPSLPDCLPDPILPVEVDPNLQGGIDPTTGLSPLGLRRAVGERAGPPYIGRGLMEAIFGGDVVANDDPGDSQDHASSLRAVVPRFPECPGDCISGRHNENTSNQAFIGGDPAGIACSKRF